MRYISQWLEWLLSKRQEITRLGEDVEKSGPCTVLGKATMENGMEIPQQIKNRAILCSYSTSGYLSSECKYTDFLKRRVHSYVQCSIIYNS